MVGFIRFVCADPHPVADAELGMFAARDEIDFSELKGSIQRAHDEAWYWFSPEGKGGLHRPTFTGAQRTRNIRRSLFWFRPDASFHGQPKGSLIHRARELATVLSSAGVEMGEISMQDPGKIIWEDRLQVLALPQGPIPKAFAVPET